MKISFILSLTNNTWLEAKKCIKYNIRAERVCLKKVQTFYFLISAKKLMRTCFNQFLKNSSFYSLFPEENLKSNRLLVLHHVRIVFPHIYPWKIKSINTFIHFSHLQIDSNYHYELFSHYQTPFHKKKRKSNISIFNIYF